MHRTFRKGAIITSGFSADGGGIQFDGAQIMAEMRLAALYFDLALQPRSQDFYIQQEDYLESIGFLRAETLPRFGFSDGLVTSGSFAGRPLAEAVLVNATDKIPSSGRKRWSLIGEHPSINSEIRSLDTLYLQLLAQFPVPSENTNLEDIIAFNRENGHALLEFRNSISELAQKLFLSAGHPAIRDLVSDTINKKIEDIDRSLRRTIGSKILETMQIGFGIPVGLALEPLSIAFGAPIGLATAISNSVQLSFAKSPLDSRQLAPDCHYVFKVKRDFDADGKSR